MRNREKGIDEDAKDIVAGVSHHLSAAATTIPSTCTIANPGATQPQPQPKPKPQMQPEPKSQMQPELESQMKPEPESRPIGGLIPPPPPLPPPTPSAADTANTNPFVTPNRRITRAPFGTAPNAGEAQTPMENLFVRHPTLYSLLALFASAFPNRLHLFGGQDSIRRRRKQMGSPSS